MAVKRPPTAEPVVVAAVDAGSNAIRLLIARADPAGTFEPLHVERAAVRLRHNVFTHYEFDEATIEQALEAFTQFKKRFTDFGVNAYRAVATSATREAVNRKTFLKRVAKETGIRLQVIDGVEEARLVRLAVAKALGTGSEPRLIVDLGGGSLEINLMKKGQVEQSFTLPIGTVRLMESFGISGAMTEEQVENIRGHVLGALKAQLPEGLDLGGKVAVGCGGNAEALAQLAPGDPMGAHPVLDIYGLHEKLWQILSLDVPERMKTYNVRQDRADVMGLAAIVFTTLWRFLNLGQMVVPGVGIREGVMAELLVEQYGLSSTQNGTFAAHTLRASAREFAQRYHYEAKHSEHVRKLALSLFDQLKPLHKENGEARLLLELGALLHDVGVFISQDKHHKHGEYLLLNSTIPGMSEKVRAMVAAMVRFHAKLNVNLKQQRYEDFSGAEKKLLQQLIAIMRLADGLDYDHRQSVKNVSVRITPKRVTIKLETKSKTRVNLWRAHEKALFFEEIFDRKVVFQKNGSGAPAKKP